MNWNRNVMVVASAVPLFTISGLATGGPNAAVGPDEGAGADTYIAKWAPTRNFGGDTRLRCKNAAPFTNQVDFDRKIYLRFDLRSVDFTATAVELALTIAPEQDGDPLPSSSAQVFRVYGLADVADGSDADADPGFGGWIEGTASFDIAGTDGISWDTAPANDGSPAGVDDSGTLLGTFELPGMGVIGSTVRFASADFDSFVSEDTNGLITLVVTRETSDPNGAGHVHAFFSSEAPSSGPLLSLWEFRQCNSADLSSPFGVLDLADIGAFTSGFLGMDPVADLNTDSIFDLADISLFIDAFIGGCP